MSLPLRQTAGHLTRLQGNETEKAVLGRFGATRLRRQIAYNGIFLKIPQRCRYRRVLLYLFRSAMILCH